MSLHPNIIAVVDDDEISLLLIKEILERKKVAESILLFSSAFDALVFFEKNMHNPAQLPSVVLLDIAMPLMSGWQFLKEFIKIEFLSGNMPAIILSTASVSVDQDLLKKYPCVKGFLLKPVIPDKLVSIIASLMSNTKNHPVNTKVLIS